MSTAGMNCASYPPRTKDFAGKRPRLDLGNPGRAIRKAPNGWAGPVDGTLVEMKPEQRRKGQTPGQDAREPRLKIGELIDRFWSLTVLDLRNRIFRPVPFFVGIPAKRQRV